jgi:hypothetical protein
MDENGMNFDEDSIEELTHALFQVMTQSRVRLTLLYLPEVTDDLGLL